MTPDQLERVFGHTRLRMATGEHVEVHREAAAPGERRRYTKRFLATSDADFREWTGREWRVLARLIGHGVGCVPDVVQFDGGTAGGLRHVQTYDAGITVDQWASLLPVARAGVVRRHVFEDCAHWWSLALHCLRALDEIHALELVHLDVKADNICIPHAPVDFDPAMPQAHLHVAFNRLALIDFAFSVVTRERLASPLPLGWQKDYDYQSPRLLRALEAGRHGDLEPTESLDWRCDLYSLAAMLRRYLPDDPCARSDGALLGWTLDRYEAARALVYRLRELHDRDLPAWRPHRELMDAAREHLAAEDLARSLTAGWTLSTRADPFRGAALATPVTRIAAPRAPSTMVTGTTLVVAPRAASSDDAIATQTPVQRITVPGVRATGGVTASSVEPSFGLAATEPPAVLRTRADVPDTQIVSLRLPVARARPRVPIAAVGIGLLAAVIAAAAWPFADDVQTVARAAWGVIDRVRTSLAPAAGTPASERATSERVAARAQPAVSERLGEPAVAPRAEPPSTRDDASDVAATEDVTGAAVASSAPTVTVASDESGAHTTAPPADAVERASPPPVPPRTASAAPGARTARPAAGQGTRPDLAPKRGDTTSWVAKGRHGAAMAAARPASGARPAPSVANARPQGARQANARLAAPLAFTSTSTGARDATRRADAPSSVHGSAAPKEHGRVIETGVMPAAVPANTGETSGHRAAAPVDAPGGVAAAPTAAAVAQATTAVAQATTAPPTTTASAAPTPRPRASRHEPWRDGFRDVLAALGLRNQRPAPIEDRAAPARGPAVSPATQSVSPASQGVAAATQGVAAPAASPSALGPPPAAAITAAAPAASTAPVASPAPAAPTAPTASRTGVPAATRVVEAATGETFVESVPRVAELAYADVAQVLRSAAMPDRSFEEDAIVDAATRPWRSERAYVRITDPAAGSTLHARARQAYATGRDREAHDLAIRAFSVNPRDANLAGLLAFLELRAGAGHAEVARQLALNALAFRGPRRSQQLEDWDTLAVASALTGRQADATGAFLVGLALSGNVERTCRVARQAYATYGERLRPAVEALQRRIRMQWGGSNDCAVTTLAYGRDPR